MSDNLPANVREKQQIEAYYEDEISLHDILVVLLRYKRLILLTAFVCALLAVVVSLLLTPIYRAKTSFLPPSLMDVSELNALETQLGYKEVAVTQSSLYGQFQTLTQSSVIKRKVFDEVEISKDYPDDDVNEVFDGYFEKYSLVQPKAKKKEKNTVPIVSLTLEGERSDQIADVLNKITTHADKQVIQNIASELKTVHKNKIDRLGDQIRALKKYSVNSVQDEIVKLTENDKLSEATIKEKIQALRHTATIAKQDRMRVLTEAASIANKIGLIEPFSMKDDGLKIELLDQPKPLYFRGTKALRAEIDELQNRKSDDPFISGLRGLQQKLELLKENEDIKILQQRKNNDAFIADLRKKELELSRLQAIEIDTVTMGLHAVSLDQKALPPVNKIKPKRSLIVAIGLLLGLMLGVMIAFLKNYLQDHPLDDA